MKRILIPIASVALTLSSQGALTEVYTYSGATLGIPDGSPSGLASVQTVTGSEILLVQSVKVTLNVTGNFNGDLYAYLQHGSGMAILLNRPGRTGIDLFGYDDGGIGVTFDDLAAEDVHTYQEQTIPGSGNPLTGTWIPDGRAVDPNLVVATDPQTAMLNSFAGGDANGEWTLFVADMSGGDAHQLVSWSVEVNGIPEPGTVALLVMGAGLLARRRR
jgi:subtilisin-like proprotein convertase family protein